LRTALEVMSLVRVKKYVLCGCAVIIEITQEIGEKDFIKEEDLEKCRVTLEPFEPLPPKLFADKPRDEGGEDSGDLIIVELPAKKDEESE